MNLKSLKYLISLANLRIVKVVCNSVDKDFLKLDLCEVKPNKQGIPAISVVVRLLQENALLVVNHTWNACEALRSRRKPSLFQSIYNKISQCSNLNHTCPYNHDIYVKDFAPAKMSIPVPNGNYMIKSTFSIGGKRRITVDIYVRNF